ncbi:DUF7289 family protein [Natronoarchaeum rubrum]|uniref:DUF7289 family protein n=1 Tax=Natronoarchaeum rubrum TaxID=755311 RepID=UPI002112A2E1|nr:hypothetical protein [Natronoarchaeum rubrum]
MIGPQPERSSRLDDRAVSDVLAFILVFSIIITSVGLVYVFGMGALGDAQVSEQNRNAERAFETLTVNFNDLQDGSGEVRVSQINPRGGGISVDDETQLTVEIGTDTPVSAQPVGSLNYRHEGTEISYELGAAFRADDGNSVMVRPPEFVCTTSGSGPDRAVLSYANLQSTQPSSVTRSSTLRIRATGTGSDVIRSSGTTEVTIEDSTHADAWERYFDSEGWDTSRPTSDSTGDVTATCETNGPSSVTFVRGTQVEVELL